MAVKILSLVWDGYPGGGPELLTLLSLADWSDDNGRCWPSMAAIAKKTRVSEKQARRVVHALIEADFLKVTDNTAGGAMSRRYQINVKALAALGTPPMDGSPPADGSPPMDVPVPSHGREGTPPMDGRRTVNDTSTTVKGSSVKAAEKVRKAPGLTCPTADIVALYHDHMPANPRCKMLTAERQKAIAARWNEAAKLSCKPFGYSSVSDGLNAWRQFFETCAESRFLTGRAPAADGKRPFLADIDFLMRPSSFAKCLENKYHRDLP